jgi:outer membrane protein assembly factor BamB
MLQRFLSLVLFVAASARGADVKTYHNDNSRSGLNPNETILTPANVQVASFGKLFTIAVDGKVDAEPLYLAAVTFPVQGTRNGLYLATEHDSVYAFDADTGAQLWKVSMLKPGETPSDNRNCGQVTPEIGVTSTPVLDRATGSIYVVAMSKDGSGAYHQRIHALDLTTGAEKLNGPIDVQATVTAPVTGANVVFDPKQYKERASLLLLNGVIYTSWSSHCDISPYTGWVIGYSETTLAQTSVFNFTPNGSDGSVWMAGAGPATDAAGNIYFLAANGTFDTTLDSNGFPNKGDFGNAFMKLSTTNNHLAAADYFTMFNTVAESNSDEDLGSGGALVLPDIIDSQSVTHHLAVGAGKDRHIYLVDRDNMGKFSASGNSIYQDLTGILGGQEFAMPAYFNGAIYYGAVGDAIKALRFDSGAKLPSTATAVTSQSFAYPGATPSISSNGTANGIVWATENTNPAVLHAFDAGNLSELYNSNMAGNQRDHFGAGNKFITPMIANGKVYVATTNGVGVFGLISAGPVAVPLTGLQCNLPGGTFLIPSLSSAVCTATLASPSPSAEPVALLSNSPYLTVPASVTVPAGAKSADFTINTGRIPNGTNATITATAGGASKSVTLFVFIAVTSVTCSPAALPAGASATCTVTLGQTQPIFSPVGLSSSSAALTLPSSINVPPGVNLGDLRRYRRSQRF